MNRKKILSAILAITMILGLILPAVFAYKTTNEAVDYREGVLIVGFDKELPEMSRGMYRKAYGLQLDRKLGNSGLEVVKVGKGNMEIIADKLSQQKGVSFVEPDYKLYPTYLTPAEVLFDQYLWGLKSSSNHGIDAELAWDLETGSSDVIVAVIDTGIQTDHPDLVGKFVPGFDFFNNDTSVYDGPHDYHGTHVAGTIAASLNGVGVVGVAPNVKIMPLKFLGPDGGYTSDAIEAIYFARDNGADLINASWGGGRKSRALERAIGDFSKPFIAAAGNDGVNTDGQKHYPSSYSNSNIVSVAATDSSGMLAGFSNYGTNTVDIAAPGVSILSTFPTVHNYAITEPEPGYYWLDGTSMASPHVAGVVALMLSENPDLSTNELINTLYSTSTPYGNLSGAVKHGSIVNAYNAVSAVSVEETEPVIVSTSPVNGEIDVTLDRVIQVEYDQPISVNDVAGIRLLLNNVDVKTGITVNNNILTINHDTFIENGSYDVVIDDGVVEGLTGLTALGTSFGFVTETLPEPPTEITIVSTTPVDGETDVVLDKVIQVAYDDSIQIIDASGIRLLLNNVDVKTGVSVNGSILTINHNLLEEASSYQVVIDDGAVESLGGLVALGTSFSFMTETLPVPSNDILVVGTSPSDGSTGVRRTVDIKITFDQAITSYTIDPTKIQISSGTTFSVSFRGQENLLITLDSALPKSTLITVTLESGVLTDGTKNSEPYEFSFTTKNK